MKYIRDPDEVCVYAVQGVGEGGRGGWSFTLRLYCEEGGGHI